MALLSCTVDSILTLLTVFGPRKSVRIKIYYLQRMTARTPSPTKPSDNCHFSFNTFDLAPVATPPLVIWNQKCDKLYRATRLIYHAFILGSSCSGSSANLMLGRLQLLRKRRLHRQNPCLRWICGGDRGFLISFFLFLRPNILNAWNFLFGFLLGTHWMNCAFCLVTVLDLIVDTH